MQATPLGGDTLYFAYGANLSRAHMVLWCPDAVPLVRATLPDYRLVFRSWADIVPSHGDRVQGALYEVNLKDLAGLDQFEDCPVLYRRIHVRILSERMVFDAMTYQMNPGHALALPHPDYLALILGGYEDWKLDTGPLARIESDVRDDIERRMQGPAGSV